MKKILFLLIFGLVLFGCVNQQPVSPVDTANNTTALIKTAEYGDVVYVDYVLRLENQTIVDTSIESVAKESGLYSDSRTYAPLEAQLLNDSGLINGFVNGIVGMKQGETKLVVVSPEEGYGKYEESKLYPIELYYNMSKQESVPTAYLEQQGVTLEKGKWLKSDNGVSVSIVNFTNETTLLEYKLKKGDALVFNGLPQLVEEVYSDLFLMKINVEEGKQYLVTNQNGQQEIIKIANVTNSTAMIDENPVLAGKTLYFTITLKKVQ